MSNFSDPSHDALPVTFDADAAVPTRGIYVGAAGTISVRTSSGNDRTFTGAQAGTVIPIRAKRINASGTTIAAADLLFLL